MKARTRAFYRIELLVEAEMIKRSRVNELPDEANQILSIVGSSVTAARTRQFRNRQSPVPNRHVAS